MILIVDDDPLFLEKARLILNQTRQVFLASTSRHALRLAADLGFSVVLVDLDLGSEDGLVLIRQIHQTFPGLPIIAVTESPRRAVIELAQEFGAVEILRKPVTPEWKPVVERVRAMADRT
jgi:CheY-like chemotaxis protein